MCKRCKELSDFNNPGRVETIGRLIQDQKFRIVQQCARKPQTL
jgi:hypothetical protein